MIFSFSFSAEGRKNKTVQGIIKSEIRNKRPPHNQIRIYSLARLAFHQYFFPTFNKNKVNNRLYQQNGK